MVSLSANVWREWNWIAVVNPIAYYNTATIMAVKSFIVQASGIVFTTLQYLCNLHMGPIGQCVTLH